MKRRLFLVAILLMFFVTALGVTKTAFASTSSTPSVGDKISGFTVKRLKYDADTNSMNILMEHDKTGARLLVINNNDTNRGFSIKFDTPADNDKGINHIIEHSVLGGSKKYPSNNVIFDVSNTTYTSFLNAFTYQNMTMYPICSKSEEQLMKSVDIYLDSVFNPLLLTDRRIFEREGWRYELKSADSNITLNGIVYNEMQGNMGSIEQAASANASKAIFPYSNQGYISGGDPEDIPKLTYKEFVATYKKNYHPSNSLMILYGDVDYKTFCQRIDYDYLSNYSKKKYTIDRGTQKPFKELVEKTYDFPVAKGSDTKNKAVIELVFATEDLKSLGGQNYVELATAISLLNLDNSSIKKAMMASGIADSYSIYLDSTTFQPVIHFTATNADPTRKRDFYQLVMKELKQIVKNGLDTELVKSSLRSLEFKKAIGNTDSSAVNMMSTVSLYDNLFNDVFFDYNGYYKNMVVNLDKKVIEEEIEKRIIKNTFAALTVTIPKAGLLEEKQKKTEKMLAEKKASMKKNEVLALVNKTADFNTWNNQKTSDEVLKSLRAVSIKDLKVEVKDRATETTTVDKASLITTTADVASIGAARYYFDLSHLTGEELLYLKFYSDMVANGMATENRTESQVLNESAQKAYSLSEAISVNIKDKKDENAYPVYILSYYAFEEDYKAAFDLAYDTLLKSNLKDIRNYGSRAIANIKTQYQYQFAEPLSLALYRSLAYTSKTYRYYNYLYGLDYYKFVLSLEETLAKDPEAVAKKLEEIRAKAFNKSNLTVLFAGSSNSVQAFKENLTDFTAKLPDQTYDKASVNLPVPAKREALTTNTTVQYLCANASLAANNIEQSGKMTVINTILNNLMLTPEIRLKGGAYGVSAITDNDNYVVYTYRDSNFVNSLTTIGGTDEFLKTIKPLMTEETLESYKLSAFAASSPVTNELVDAISTLSNLISGFTKQDVIDNMTQIKKTTIADISTYAEYMQKLNSNMNYVIVGTPSDIEANKELFDDVISLK